MSALDRIYVEADETATALSWLLEQWRSDTDPVWQDHVLIGLREEDPGIFATLDAICAEDAGESLLSDLPFQDGSDAAAVPDGGPAAAPSSPRLARASMNVEIVGDEIAYEVASFSGGHGGQVQISDPDHEWKLHLLGLPAGWRHLSKVIEDAAMELERQIADRDSRMVSPLGDSRERPVPCADCARPTWNIRGVCCDCMDRD